MDKWCWYTKVFPYQRSVASIYRLTSLFSRWLFNMLHSNYSFLDTNNTCSSGLEGLMSGKRLETLTLKPPTFLSSSFEDKLVQLWNAGTVVRLDWKRSNPLYRLFLNIQPSVSANSSQRHHFTTFFNQELPNEAAVESETVNYFLFLLGVSGKCNTTPQMWLPCDLQFWLPSYAATITSSGKTDTFNYQCRVWLPII